MDKYPEVCTPEIVNNLKDDLLKLTKILDLIGTVDNSVVHKEFVILNKKIVGSCLAHLGFDNTDAATLSMRLHPAAAQLGINQTNLAKKMNSHIKNFLLYLENGTEPEPEPEPEPMARPSLKPIPTAKVNVLPILLPSPYVLPWLAVLLTAKVIASVILKVIPTHLFCKLLFTGHFKGSLAKFMC